MSNSSNVWTMATAKLPPVITIPILILRKSQMELKQKLGIGVFLSLSVVMILASTTRYAGYHLRADSVDATWLIFWVYLEASIAIIVASTTAFRTLFARGGSDPRGIKKRPKVHNLNAIRKRLSRKTDWEATDRDLPKIPSPTLTGMNTFIYNNGRSGETATAIRPQDNYSMDEEKSQLSSHEIGQHDVERIARGWIGGGGVFILVW